MLEAEIIAHCAPTLAGIKTANMFTYTPMNRNKLSMEIEEENRKLNCRGVFVEVLRTSEYKAAHPDWALVISGRQPIRSRSQLVLDMSREDVTDYLTERICDIVEKADIQYNVSYHPLQKL